LKRLLDSGVAEFYVVIGDELLQEVLDLKTVTCHYCFRCPLDRARYLTLMKTDILFAI
jgi:hypothetical protein